VSFSLYIHIPYCQAKCPYCDFNSYAAPSWPENDYTNAIISELRSRAAEAPWYGDSIRTIFFGGGTPSLFDPHSIQKIIEAAHAVFAIDLNAEITLETNPGTVDGVKLAGFRAAGVNRISFGAQSFKTEILKFLGRIHDAQQTRDAVHHARRSGFARINLDLIFAVPGQSLADVINDIENAVALEPDHISAYNLTFEEGTNFFAERKRGRIRELAIEEQAAMYAAVRTELPARGFPMYEISNYAPLGHEARHNLTYWRGESYLGLGAGAHSFGQNGQAGRRWWNHKLPATYIQKALKERNAEAGFEIVDAQTAASEFVFCNLRLTEGFALDTFKARFGREFDDLFGRRSSRLFEGGLLLRENGRVRLSDRGFEIADSIFAEFI
jgi:oxygen-independent coproporphyrinogen-3 oxidase